MDELIHYLGVSCVNEVAWAGFHTPGGVNIDLDWEVPKAESRLTQHVYQLEVVDLEGNCIGKVLIRKI